MTSDDVKLRAAACVLYRFGFGHKYYNVVGLLKKNLELHDEVPNPWTNDHDLRALLATSLSTNYILGNYHFRNIMYREIVRPGYGGKVIAGMIENGPAYVIENALEIAKHTPGIVSIMIYVFYDLDQPLDKIVAALVDEYANQVAEILSELEVDVRR